MSIRHRLLPLGLLLLLTEAAAADPPLSLTEVGQLPALAQRPANACFELRLEGDLWWVAPGADQLVLHDSSGTQKLQLDLQNRSFHAGQHVRITGHGTVARSGDSFQLGVVGPVVDNNGTHALIEKSGSVYLPAGPQPLRIDWFNGINQYGLQIEYAGPGLPRQPIPSALLTPPPPRRGPGLAFAVYDVPGEILPDFTKLTPLQTGSLANAALPPLPHPEHVGVQLEGTLSIAQSGLYTFFVSSDDGSRLFVGQPSLEVSVIGTNDLPQPRTVALGRPLEDDNNFQWARVQGAVTFASEGTNAAELELASGTGRMRLALGSRLAVTPDQLLGRQVRALGLCEAARTADGHRLADTLLVAHARQLELVEPGTSGPDLNTNTNSLPILTTAAAVHRLKREEAQRGYPVRIQGVVTCVLPEHQAFTLQDATRGIYVVDLSDSRPFLPRIGEYLEVGGSTDPLLFAPIVNARELRSLGEGRLPDPVHPPWDQLLNGSLDAQYVELQGIITAVDSTNITLLTRDGRINVELRVPGLEANNLVRYQDAVVRLRGTLFANWNYLTHEVKAGEIRLYGAAVTVDQPVPADLFALPNKTVEDLFRFDPQASVFQRVKVAGQVLHSRDPEFYLGDGHRSLRFIVRKQTDLAAGDLVEVTGFPDLGGASPMLREAVARKTGRAPLPPAQLSSVEELSRAGDEATLVRLRGILVSVRDRPAERVLEIQNGVRTFAARLDTTEPKNEAPPLGSLLELTGVYAGLGANRSSGPDISAFELLLNSPQDIQVLARPPWWTLQRLLIIVGALVCGLAVTGLWITELHRKVEQRTSELAAQIQERQRVEQQRAMEQERARVAQDLHDELGSGLTEISMLGARARAAHATDEKRRTYLNQMSEKAREMVTALDEIVWAMNPRHDSLASLVSYFSLYADRFLGLANIAWHLEDAAVPNDFVVDSQHRHQLFLAFKEGLNNVVRHSQAREVRIAIGLQAGQIRVTISDNGRGLPADPPTGEMDGVANMRARLAKLGGRFELVSQPGRGTTLNFLAPAQ